MAKVTENYDGEGKATSYNVCFRFLFWWIPAGVLYVHREDAVKACNDINNGGVRELDT